MVEAGLPVLRLEIAANAPLQQLPPLDARGNSIPYISLNGQKENIRVDIATARGRGLVDAVI